MGDLQEIVEVLIDTPLELDEKVDAVAAEIINYIIDEFYESVHDIAEDVVFGRIAFPNVIELTCRLD